MQAWTLTAFGLDKIACVDRPEPTPGPGEVLVRVKAVSLNYRDLLIAKGLYNPRLPFPRVLCSDSAGEVIAVGDGVTAVKPGDHVASCFFQDWADGPITDAAAKSALGGEIDGILAERVVLKERGVVPIPYQLSFEEAATLPCAAVTAWNALTTDYDPAGKTVLVQGTGGVSIFALQFAKALGATVLATSGHDVKLARVLSLGADAGTNYKTNPDWDKWAKQQSNGGVDLVVEVGGAGTLDKSVRSIKPGGRIALIGVLAGGSGFNPLPLMMKGGTLRGIFVGSRAMFLAMNRLLAEKQLRPVVDRVFSFADAPAAFRHLESGSHLGKVVVSVG
jgi:NADPH:quinone reductase-like Zn-dependent oxidoreductase